MRKEMYDQLWTSFLSESESEEIESVLSSTASDEDSEMVKIKASALQRLLLDYDSYLKKIEETLSESTKEERVKALCRRYGFKSFVDFLKIQNLIQRAEKGKLNDD